MTAADPSIEGFIRHRIAQTLQKQITSPNRAVLGSKNQKMIFDGYSVGPGHNRRYGSILVIGTRCASNDHEGRLDRFPAKSPMMRDG